jgi:hypothetical protein
MNSARARIDRETGSLRLPNDGKGLYFRPVMTKVLRCNLQCYVVQVAYAIPGRYFQIAVILSNRRYFKI